MTKKAEEFAIEAFSVLSFLRDKEVGCFDDEESISRTFYNLPEDMQEIYKKEAKYYLYNHAEDDWPLDIEETLKKLEHR